MMQMGGLERLRLLNPSSACYCHSSPESTYASTRPAPFASHLGITDLPRVDEHKILQLPAVRHRKAL